MPSNEVSANQRLCELMVTSGVAVANHINLPNHNP